jgi:hydroxyethylthiazole kinase-like uncharacterized protein yjeF
MSSPIEVTPQLLRTMPVPEPQEGGKDKRGRVLIVAGSTTVPGAAVLSATAAYRTGAGRVRIATAPGISIPVGVAVPEAMVLPLRETASGRIDPDESLRSLADQATACDAVLIGPGMDQGSETARLARDLCAATSACVVLDAAALSGLTRADEAIRGREGALIITPHAGEMARLLDIPREGVERDLLGAARSASDRWGCIVVMKGPQTYIVGPARKAWVFKGGSVGLAMSGSGDVLAGIITALVARGCGPAEAAVWGVFLHGEAGCGLSTKLGPLGFLARELAGQVPQIMRHLARSPTARGRP